ncbi:MAG: hypothetical protein IPM22_17750 [Betaproteobacteria bacterium]|nr:hypothetical protein [Betaproteobacteria bacterium]
MAAPLRVRSLLHAYGTTASSKGWTSLSAPGRIGCRRRALRLRQDHGCCASHRRLRSRSRAGEILLSDSPVSSATVQVPPERRGISMLFGTTRCSRISRSRTTSRSA